jgi:hypothetical protein
MTETFLEALTPTAPPAAAKTKPAPKNSYWEGRKAAVYLYVCKLLCQKYGPDSGTVIDVGSNGTPTLEWHRKWATRMVSLDLVRPYRAEAVESLKQDFFKFEPTEQFDLVTCFQVLEHVPDPQVFAQKLLSIGKVLVVSVPYKWRAGACKHHIHDPVDEEKMFAWFGRKPDYSYVARELNNVERLIQVYRNTEVRAPAARAPELDPTMTYPLGFLLGRPAGAVPAHFRELQFPVPLRVNTTTRIGLSRGERESVAVVGEALDPDAPELDHDGVARMVLDAGARRQSVVDRLIGRFVVIRATADGDAFVQTDAIGLRSVFFAGGRDGVVAGSHAKMVAQAVSGPDVKATPRPMKWGYPGMGTPYQGVHRLPANSELSLRDGSLRRFFPLAEIPRTTMEEVWTFAFDQAAKAVDALRRRTPVVVSLTAGLDSRTTLAVARRTWPDLRFFTYVQTSDLRQHHQIDLAVSRALAKTLSLRHEAIDLADVSPNPQWLDVLRENVFANHIRPLACAYRERFGAHKYVHIRTNLLELARSNLYTKGNAHAAYRGGPSTPEKMTAYYTSRGVLARTDHVHPAFEHYARETHFTEALNYASAWDLYFVEHRMGAWQAGVVGESEIAFDTVIAFNSREIVRRMMGVPQEVRSASGYLLELLTRTLPEAADIPINPKSYPPASA